MARNLQVLLASRPEGWVTEANFEIVERDVPEAAPRRSAGAQPLAVAGPVHARPHERRSKSYAASVDIGAVMVGGTVGEIIESKHPRLKVGPVSSSARSAGSNTPPPPAMAWRWSIRSWCRCRRTSVRSACPASRPGSACSNTASPRPARRSWCPRHRARWVVSWASSRRCRVAARWASPAAARNANTRSRNWASTPASTTRPASCTTTSRPPARTASTALSRTSAAW